MFFDGASDVVLPLQNADAQVLVGLYYDVDVVLFEGDQQSIHSGREIRSMAGAPSSLSSPQAGEEPLQALFNIIVVGLEDCC